MIKQLNEIIYTYSDYLKKKYGKKVFRVGLSTGITCPHRANNGGCIYCNSVTFTGEYQYQSLSITEQLEIAIPKIRKSCGDVDLLAYFQDETSTAGNIDFLRKQFTEALSHPEIIGLVLSTRPDFFDETHAEMLQSLNTPIMIEFGVQSIHEKSLKYINRGHTYSQAKKAIELAANYDFEVGVHLIMGLPTENFSEMKQTILEIGSNPHISQVKFHNLVIYKNTKLADMYENEKFKILTIDQYIIFLAHLLTYLRKDIVVSRLFTSNIQDIDLEVVKNIGPKTKWIGKLFHYMRLHNLSQGCNL